MCRVCRGDWGKSLGWIRSGGGVCLLWRRVIWPWRIAVRWMIGINRGRARQVARRRRMAGKTIP